MANQRIDSIDALRGLSLFGILLTHCISQFLGVLPEEHRDILHLNILDTMTSAGIGAFFGGKFFLIFSLLFGVSFGIQRDSSQEKRGSFFFYYLWRLILLGGIGFCHYLIFQGDILIPYSLMGVLLLLLSKQSTKFLMTISLLLLTGFPRLLIHGFNVFFGKVETYFYSHNPEVIFQKNFLVSTEGSFSDVVSLNLTHWFDMVSIFQYGYFGRSYQILSLFLIGLIFHRLNFFSSLEEHKKMLVKAFKFFTLGSFLSALGMGMTFYLNNGLDFKTWMTMFTLTFYDWFNLCFTAVIISGFSLFYLKNKGKKFFDYFIPTGKMSLTIYLTQSLFFTGFYFNWGLGLFGKFGVFLSVLIGIIFFIFQTFMAKLWLKRFKQGPIEFIWKKASQVF